MRVTGYGLVSISFMDRKESGHDRKEINRTVVNTMSVSDQLIRSVTHKDQNILDFILPTFALYLSASTALAPSSSVVHPLCPLWAQST